MDGRLITVFILRTLFRGLDNCMSRSSRSFLTPVHRRSQDEIVSYSITTRSKRTPRPQFLAKVP